MLKSVEKAKNEARQKKKPRTEKNDDEKGDAEDLKNKGKEVKDKGKADGVKMKKLTNVEASKPQTALKQQQSTEGKSQSVAKKKLDEQLSIEDLFETDVRLYALILYIFIYCRWARSDDLNGTMQC